MVCSYCGIAPSEGYFKSYCKPCADLRRMLILHEPKKCVEILQFCLLRNNTQVDNKKKLVVEKNLQDSLDLYEKPNTRNNGKK